NPEPSSPRNWKEGVETLWRTPYLLSKEAGEEKVQTTNSISMEAVKTVVSKHNPKVTGSSPVLATK
ncbi:MAG: hypothetical protein RL329_674, partial [Bacteroidota bacterium]